MKQIIIYILLTLTTTHISSQVIQGKIIDQENSPIPYSLISWNQGSMGLYSNEDGTFKIDSIKSDSIQISSLGYKNKSIFLGKLEKDTFMVFQLEKSSENLPEVIVSPKKYRVFKQEIKKKKNPSSLGFRINRSKASSIQGTVFNNDKTGIFSSVAVHILDRGDPSTSNTSLRLRIFSLDAQGKPDKSLLNQNVILSKKRGWIVTDIQDLNIPIPPGGYFIAIEALHVYTDARPRGNPSITLSKVPKKEGVVSWVRRNRSNDWHHFLFDSETETFIPVFKVKLLVEE